MNSKTLILSIVFFILVLGVVSPIINTSFSSSFSSSSNITEEEKIATDQSKPIDPNSKRIDCGKLNVSFKNSNGKIKTIFIK